MLNSDDIARMKATTADIIADQKTSIVIMRGEVDLDAQDVRLVGLSYRPLERMTIGGDVVHVSLLVLGEVGLDIQRGDRFFVGEDFYEVLALRPGEDVKVVAECVLKT